MKLNRHQRRESDIIDQKFRDLFHSFTEEEDRLSEIEEGYIIRPDGEYVRNVFVELWRQFANNWNGNPKHKMKANFQFFRDNISTFRLLRDRAEWAKYTLKLCKDYGLICSETDVLEYFGNGLKPDDVASEMVNSCKYPSILSVEGYV